MQLLFSVVVMPIREVKLLLVCTVKVNEAMGTDHYPGEFLVTSGVVTVLMIKP